MTTKMPIFYVTTDPLRALGIEDYYDEFFVICIDYTDVVDILIKRGISIFCVEKELGKNVVVRNSRKLLLNDAVQEFILEHSTNDVGVIFFKPLFSLDTVISSTKLGKNRTVVSLNASPSISSLLENKLNFLEICTANKIAHPDSFVDHLNNLSYSLIQKRLGNDSVVQFERGWFGNRTFFVSLPSDLEKLQKLYTNRKVKISKYISGITLTVNAVVNDENVYQTYPFVQLNDEPHSTQPLARMQASTIGNSWTDLTVFFGKVTDVIVSDIYQMVKTVGSVIRELSYKGFFGVDVLVDAYGRVYMQEINPRFTASTQMISSLEDKSFGNSLLKEHYRTFGVQFKQGNALPENYYTRQLLGSRVICRNVDRKGKLVVSAPKNGVYAYQGTEFEFQKGLLAIHSINPDEFILLSVGDNHRVSPDEQLFEIQSKGLSHEQLLSYARKIKTNYF
ncbi:hypothetical protein CO180_00710 [candidate division WWE3 bacterium CG_4_9_14_3_um_filter_41_6]|uniref:ATP-grasp domain-containing protein n=1 Tax=candidate division WWE3 bacterium CG_4_10_14_0_2_um_filter_41_14 TaxID=1975072 RepID=A0A2M7TID8_UNCKA|nr:MAG: hypothetical protein COY32_04770 [candidate division WWE3 bacterium CG_4_10_14_0_2_um_filter_41_14]PJA39471.1 MAG: hypothetical protein CO180_00710 [candidate division WWE3 bacterium CG_4_9_14_3_um_filter_41_6]